MTLGNFCGWHCNRNPYICDFVRKSTYYYQRLQILYFLFDSVTFNFCYNVFLNC